jgi:hypothetical protein
MAFLGKKGDRVRLVFMPNDPEPVEIGTEGTVLAVAHLPWGQDMRSQVAIAWDNGRTLSCICPPDHLEILNASESKTETTN